MKIDSQTWVFTSGAGVMFALMSRSFTTDLKVQIIFVAVGMITGFLVDFMFKKSEVKECSKKKQNKKSQ